MTTHMEETNYTNPTAINDTNPYPTNEGNLVRRALDTPGEVCSNCVNITQRSPSGCPFKLDIEGDLEVTLCFSTYGTTEHALYFPGFRRHLQGVSNINELIEAFDVIQERYSPELSYIYSTPVMSPIITVCIRSPNDENNANEE